MPNKPELGSAGERLNANTIAIVSGNLNATYLSIAYDLSAVLDNGDEFRVLPVIGKGGGQNIKDVRFLKGVDLGITQSVLLNGYRKSNEIGTIDDKIVYLAKLFNEEMHLIVRADSGITAIDQLAGRKVNFSDIGSGTQLSSRDIFEKLAIQVQEVNVGQADAFEKLKSGEIAATVLIAGKPAASMARLAAAEGFRILPVPFRKPLQADYLPATLASTDYPRLIDKDQVVEFDRGQRGADCLQLAEGHRPLPPHPEVRRHVLSEARRIPETAAASEVEGGQSRGDLARLEALCGRRRMAEKQRAKTAGRGRARSVRPLPAGALAGRRLCDAAGARGAIQRIHAVEQDASLTDDKSPGSTNKRSAPQRRQ